MNSPHATRFNQQARPLLWAVHSELVTLRTVVAGVPQTSDLRGVWKRVQPEADDSDGVGLQGYTGEATLVALVADLPTPPGPDAEIERHGETWAIRHAERQDDWTWILHLARPDAEVRMPARLRG